MPAVVKPAVVTADEAFAKLTAAGPLMRLHVRESVEPAGKPSSDAEPSKETLTEEPESMADLSGPALTTGASLAGVPEVDSTKAIQSSVVELGGEPRLRVPPPLRAGPLMRAPPFRGSSQRT